MTISKIPKTKLAALNIGSADIGTAGLPLGSLNASGAGSGQVAQWNGSAWVPASLAGAVNFIDAEIPSGSANSVNTVFHLSHNPSGTPQLFVGGQLMSPGTAGDYTFSGSVVTFTGNSSLPGPNDSFLAYYRA